MKKPPRGLDVVCELKLSTRLIKHSVDTELASPRPSKTCKPKSCEIINSYCKKQACFFKILSYDRGRQ